MGIPEVPDLHRRSIVIDGLNVSRWHEPVYRGIRDSGVTASNATVTFKHNFRDTIRLLTRWHLDFDRYPEIITQIRTVSDIRTAKERQRSGIILGFQNASPIEDDPTLLRVFWELGLRVMQLTYSGRNLLGDGCLEPGGAGLSRYGRRVVREMNRLGMVIDVSHCGRQTTLDAIEASDAPVVFTHANAKALWDNPRNHSDDEFVACAAKGGVVAVTAFPGFLPDGRRTLDGVLDMVDHIVALIGSEHVAIGLDLIDDQPQEFFLPDSIPNAEQSYLEGRAGLREWPWVYPQGIASARDWPNVTAGLLKRGHSDEDVQQIIGLNLLRLFEKVWP